jgi:hypothetical protein
MLLVSRCVCVTVADVSASAPSANACYKEVLSKAHIAQQSQRSHRHQEERLLKLVTLLVLAYIAMLLARSSQVVPFAVAAEKRSAQHQFCYSTERWLRSRCDH